jgi:hypothetical protein
MSPAGPGGPCWEDADHLLLMATGVQLGPGAPAIRVDVATGAVEGVPLTAVSDHPPAFVQPLLRPGVTPAAASAADRVE